MSEPTKALLVILGIIFLPLIGYVIYVIVSDHYKYKNAIHVIFKKKQGKVKGYVKDKHGKWKHDESLYLEDNVDSKEDEEV